MVKLFRVKEGKIYKAYKTKAPKFTHHFGRTWDEGSITIEVETETGSEIFETPIWVDTTWGKYYYINWYGSWHKFELCYDVDFPYTYREKFIVFKKK